MKAFVLLVLLVLASTAEGQMHEVTVTVDPSVTHQTIEGFGACYIDWSRGRRPEYDDPKFYDLVVNDLGMSIVRQQMQDELEPVNDDDDPSKFDWNGFKVGDVGAGWSFAARQKFLEEFKKRGVTRFVMSPWTPPSFTKTHKAGRYGGHLRMDKVDEYAEYMAASIILAKKNHGIDIGWVTVQNEPLFIEPYHSCVYNGYTIREAVRALMRRFEQEGITTQILTGEDMMFAGRMMNYVRPTMDDPETRDFPGGFCTHRQGDFAEVRKWYNATKQWGRQNWMTETSGHAQTWEGALKMAVDMYDYLVGGNFNAWIYWQITDSPTSHEYALMIDGDPSRSPKYHAAKHFYRFVRPQAVRVEGTSTDKDVLVSAFANAVEGTQTIVLINRGESDATIKLGVTGGAGGEAFDRHLSTPQLRCEQQEDISLDQPVPLPGKSIVTLTRKIGPAGQTAARPEAWIDPSPGEHWGDATDNPAANAPHRTFTPLHQAILSGNIREIDKQLAAHVNVNEAVADGWTPIHMAASTFGSTEVDGKRYSKYDVFRRILDAKPDVNVTTVDGWTPLHAAAANAHTAWQHEPAEVLNRIRDLVQAGCDINATDTAGRTPLHWAAWQGHSVLDQAPNADVVQLLLQLGADRDIKDNSGKRALDYAEQMRHEKIATALRSATTTTVAPTTAPETSNRTRGKLGRELLRAAWDGNEQRVRELLTQGADVNYVDSDGFRPIDRARDNGHTAIVELLRKAAGE